MTSQFLSLAVNRNKTFLDHLRSMTWQEKRSDSPAVSERPDNPDRVDNVDSGTASPVGDLVQVSDR